MSYAIAESTKIDSANTKIANTNLLLQQPQSSEEGSGTNNEVNGVDNVDIIKSDGVYIYTIYRKGIIVLNNNNGSVTSRMNIEN